MLPNAPAVPVMLPSLVLHSGLELPPPVPPTPGSGVWVVASPPQPVRLIPTTRSEAQSRLSRGMVPPGEGRRNDCATAAWGERRENSEKHVTPTVGFLMAPAVS